MIIAKSLSSLSNMPQMSAAFSGWTKKITIVKRVQSVVKGIVTYTDTNVSFIGTIQPLSAEQIYLKPEGQRSWRWLQIHIQNSTVLLKTTDQIIYNGETYKVMAVKDYSLNNFTEIHIVTDYQT